MSEVKNKNKNNVFSEGDVIRLVHKPQTVTNELPKLNPADFEEALGLAKARYKAEEVATLSKYHYKRMLATVKDIERNLDKLRTQIGETNVSPPWYTKLMFWRAE